MTDSMTLHDRMLAVYRGQVPDATPIGIYTRYLPRGTTERAVRNTGMGLIEYHPVISMLAPPWHMYSGYLSEVHGAELEVRYTWDHGVAVETRSYHTPVGTVSECIRKDPAYGSDWVSKFYIESPSDYTVMLYLVENTIFRRNESGIRVHMADLGGDGVVIGRMDRCPYQKLLIELAGPERFLIDLYTDPEPVLDLLEAMDRRMDEAFVMALESEVEVIWQPDNITSDLTPPDMFRKHCLPFYEKHGRECRQAGKPYHVHIDGRTRALKDLIASATFDGIESFSLPIIGGDLPLHEARAAWPGKTILPNFPSSLCLQEEAGIVAFLDTLFADTPSGAPFMLQVSEDIPPAEWQRVLPILTTYIAERDRGKSP